jgi:hypothetical protein
MLHLEVEHHSASNHNVNMTNSPQRYPSPHDRPLVHTHPSDSTAASSNAGPYQTIGIPCDGRNLPNLTLFEASGNYGVTPAGVGSSSGTNSVGAGIMPGLQVSEIYKLCHRPMALPVHHNPSQSQSQSMAQFQQHALAASRIAPNQGVVKPERARPSPKVWCPEPQCKGGFHAKKALNRHWDDCHSEEKKCYYCNFTYVGKRKLEAHLQKMHGKAPPSRRRRPSNSRS